ncbi:hypothetical protein OU994_17050 [Pseudoduganella sp. SL102]|uniref:hypothetical protein n=1 Tax=Pseudoduganella sp. SL102 TaxID=2995154 RepID=UPI00248C7901|nr:hypothetical protein [Pseudoduganella sp. SL102]WBS00032.1 hypothetical protein OU994_17050 [Pseudoduganella sp. SL102]
MKAILMLILTIWLCASAVAGPRGPHDCCADQHCPVDCIAMGCAPGAPAIAPPPALASWAVTAASAVQPSDPGGVLPSPYRTIWVPPD